MGSRRKWLTGRAWRGRVSLGGRWAKVAWYNPAGGHARLHGEAMWQLSSAAEMAIVGRLRISPNRP